MPCHRCEMWYVTARFKRSEENLIAVRRNSLYNLLEACRGLQDDKLRLGGVHSVNEHQIGSLSLTEIRALRCTIYYPRKCTPAIRSECKTRQIVEQRLRNKILITINDLIINV
jgi:hypothetical protein